MIIPRVPHAPWFRHVHCEHNTGADDMTNEVRRAGTNFIFRQHSGNLGIFSFVARVFDGGLKEGVATIGWQLYGARRPTDQGDPDWHLVAELGGAIADVVTVPAAELLAASEATRAAYLFAYGVLEVSAGTGRVAWHRWHAKRRRLLAQ